MVTKGASAGTLFFNTDDAYAAHAELKAKDVELAEEPTTQSYGIDFGFRDPFGNHIRIAQRAAPEQSMTTVGFSGRPPRPGGRAARAGVRRRAAPGPDRPLGLGPRDEREQFGADLILGNRRVRQLEVDPPGPGPADDLVRPGQRRQLFGDPLQR